MKTEEIIKRLRNPQSYQKAAAKAQQQKAQQQAVAEHAVAEKKKHDVILLSVGGLIAVLLLITGLVSFLAKTRAENLTAALDPEQVKGLHSESEFNPNNGVTYIQLQEGQDRNVAVTELGSTLPIISRFNFKSFTPEELQVIGSAPWALTTNFTSNLNDSELMRYLLSKDEVAKGFIKREDVAPLLEDPQLLAAFTEDKDAMAEFFNSDTVQKVLANEKMVRAVAGSRFMSYLLISKAGKYYRDHPQEAVKIITENPYLRQLQENPAVQAAIKENNYLKKIAPVLLENAGVPTQRASDTTPVTKGKK
jgi:hypothetical protein